ncbi:transglycosylase [Myxococcus stipitatus DSM 14675]|uniref:peptidoglycan lytic exotransglycosylase n=1 Tax=Myxococcus stipitatus (strain DSM 14675 / JCM 12634 / Mx s8) TaxID=1278073 RepID=L7UMJ4_MYXSD|nr:MltA domain-containing protein [Myxococcus stipitatus]AGC49233.1 transglycosylase [Myxococcus stipitatus DSM 14675]
MRSWSARRLWLVCLLLVGASCARVPRPAVTRPQDALVALQDTAKLVDDGGVASLRVALGESLIWLRTRPVDHRFVYGPREVTAGELVAALERLRDRLTDGLSSQDVSTAVLAEFDLLESAGGEDGTVLFTGYYEPVLDGSMTRSEEYSIPVLSAPDDLIEVPLEPFAERFASEKVFGRLEGKRLVPYWNRSAIRGGKLGQRKLELAWVRDPVALFFMEVQGSGTLRLVDGTERRVGYAASNGRPYRSIGSLLIQEGAIPKEQMSMQALRAWLAANPTQRDRVLDHNESYVFFRFLPGAAVGSLGREVTPGRSIATDARLFPKGGLAFIQTDHPVKMADGSVQWKPLARFMFNQDTGGAIRGAGRVDVFWGRGPEAELAAGMMKQKGRLFFLVPKPRAVVAVP